MKLNLKTEAGRLLAPVEGVEDDAVRLGANRLEVERLPLEDIDPEQLVRLMRERKYGFDPGWMADYPAVLSGKSVEKRLAKYDSPGARLLAEHARDDYPVRLQGARAAAVLATLAAAELPGVVEEAEETLATVAALLEEHGELELVRGKRRELRALTSEALAVLFEDREVFAPLRGELEELGARRIRVTYDFEDEAELEDFRSGEYLLHAARSDEERPFRAPTVKKGSLHLRGLSFARHRLGFGSDVRVTCRFRLPNPEGAHDPRMRLLLGVSDDSQGNYAAADCVGTVFVEDGQSDHYQTARSPVEGITLGEWHELELSIRGRESLIAELDGKTAGTVPVGPRTAGAVFLWGDCDHAIEVTRLEIEGTVLRASIEDLGREWIAARLRALGLE